MKMLLRLTLVCAIVWILARGAIYLLPGNPADFLVQESLVQISTQELQVKMDLGGSALHRIFSLPHTVSLINHQNAWSLAQAALLRSLILAALALLFGGSTSLALLYLSYASKRWKNFSEWYALVAASTPLFILGPLLLLLFSLRLRLFPITQNPILPAITLGIYLSAFWYRTLSKKIETYLPESAASGARARGIPEAKIFFFYILYPSLGSFMSFFGTQIGTLLNGSILVEIIFQWRGLGILLADSVASRDYPMIELCLMLVTLITLLSQQLGYAVQRKMEPRLS